MKTATTLVVAAFCLLLNAGTASAQNCYEFTGQSEFCFTWIDDTCEGDCVKHPQTQVWNCPHSHVVDIVPTPSWDGWRNVASGYGADGGGMVWCTELMNCDCDDVNMTGEDDTCIDDESSLRHIMASVPNIDINTPCPEV